MTKHAALEEPAGDLQQQAVSLAEELLSAARASQTADEREQAQRIARMMEDPQGKELTIAMVDQAFRSHEPARIADQISHLLDEYGTPRYMDWWERAALTLGGVMGHYLPGVVVPPVIARLRQETRSVILPAEETDLRKYLQQRRAQGTRLNLNQLGEAILGEAEAERRMSAYLDLLARPDVEYISVKVSSVFSQINLVAYRHTADLVKERLRTLYRQAMSYRYEHPHPEGTAHRTYKFVNLDMEEYRDLHLTVDTFREVLDEDEFKDLSAGIVLQAYVPDSYEIQRELTEWAMQRLEDGGAPIKIRIVKGANLAMERVEASLHRWPQAPYTSKVQVDANFKRMLHYGFHPQRAAAVHLGIGSHNLFDVAYALALRDRTGVDEYVEFEMLEGMANHQARAVQARAGGLLLYAPVVKSEDFHSAIAYLVRRLDENTAPQNFLHDLFGMEPGSAQWNRQRDQFLDACALVGTVKSTPNRIQDRRNEYIQPDYEAPFQNEPDTDWSLPANQKWVNSIVEQWKEQSPEAVPLQIGGEFVHTETQADGISPARPDHVAYRYARAGADQVARALSIAVKAQAEWGSRSIAERSRVLDDVAAEFARRRAEFIGAIMLECGKIPAESDPEVSEGIDFTRYYARAFEDLSFGLRDKSSASTDEQAAAGGYSFDPFGVVVVTPPWNFPFAIPSGGVAAALMAGNAVIFKPAPEATLVGWHIAQAMWAAGVPKNVLQFLPVPDDEVGRKLITDERTAAVILTGSIETARMFQDWRPHLRLFAETSGKNALIVSAMSDRDQAIQDLVHSAFAHSGQKCSAASLGILEAEVYDDPVFRRQLKDAVASRVVGSAWDLVSRQTPLTQPPSPRLLRALTQLEPGEEWLLEPEPVPHHGQPVRNTEEHLLWSPGIKLGVKPGSFFHTTECFGPVLGLMRADDVDHAIELANAVDFGLTGGIHTLDDREVERYKEHIEVGNAYINRHITGAVVRRQPFGGWKGSNVGPGAKAGGPNYVIQFGNWRQESLPRVQNRPAPQVAALLSRLENQVRKGGPSEEVAAELAAESIAGTTFSETLKAAASSYARAWSNHFSRDHDPSQVLGEQNVFRYRPLDGLLLRAEKSSTADRNRTDRSRTSVLNLAMSLLAAVTVDARVQLSLGPGLTEWHWLDRLAQVELIVEEESSLVTRLQSGDVLAGARWPRFRALQPLSTQLRRALNDAGVNVVTQPVLTNGRLELRYYLREQAISQTVHRYGNIISKYEHT